MIQKLVLLALAGAVGTLARYGLSGLVHRIDGVTFPWGTIVVNVLGCFIVGLLWSLFENRWTISGETRIIILVGFIGAFTTFSAMILESSELIRSAEWFRAVGNITIQNVVGFIALFGGSVLGRLG